MNNTTALAGGGGVGAALTYILTAIDARNGWGYDAAFYSACIGVAFGAPAFLVEACRYFWRLRREAHGEETQSTQATKA